MMNEPIRIPDETLRQQFASSDPKVSAWVSANAGAGKTHVLTQRVIRLMLSGSAPDRILCLTFTKAAAANMKNRVFETLAGWTMLEDSALDEAIEKLSGRSPTPKQRNKARRLFARALDAPGGLKIQTIHAFCEALLHQFPLEANVPGHFETLQELGQADLLEQAKSYVLSGKSKGSSALEDFAALNGRVTHEAIEAAIGEIIGKRNRFKMWTENGIDTVLAEVSSLFELQPEDTETTVLESGFEKLQATENKVRELAEISAQSDKSTDQKQSVLLKQFLDNTDLSERYQALASATLKANWEPRSGSRILTAYVKKRMPDAVDLLARCGEAVLEMREQLNSVALIDFSRHIFHIADAVLDRYEALKRARGVIDFDDQVDKCANLLTRSEIRDWIRYRLDRGIDHMLVDEAQDTSPRQWEVINAITADFHSGATANVSERTVFVVGDEKQSIYSFQGAEPQEFARQEHHLKKAVEAAQKLYHPGSLSLSFRSTTDVLHAVDTVFSSEENRAGLTQSGDRPVHDAIRSSDPGEVQVWPLFEKEAVVEPEDWLAPIDQEGRSDPAVQLAERITRSIGEWVGKPLPGSPNPLKFGDILVLVRKRDRFITALTRTMKDAGLQVAGADRIVLTEHIAVEDLLAIGQFALLPLDDLNLAAVLKGVLFDLDEETLFEFAYEREKTLIDAIHTAGEDPSHNLHTIAKSIMERLNLLKSMAAQLDVFEFFAWVLGPFGARMAFLARLGMEAEDVLDAFLDESLSFTREGGIGLENFVASLKRAKPEIKREVELDRDEVRILTVHAAKGLEAKVVFLVDPCNPPWTEKHRPKFMQIGAPESPAHVWLPSKELHNKHTQKSTDAIRQAAEGEYRRLLYVGMTRAADRLIMCGYRGIKKPNYRHWHTMVYDALATGGTEVFDEQGEVLSLIWQTRRMRPDRVDETISTERRKRPDKSKSSLPDWATTLASCEPPLPMPLSPAGAHALIDEERIQSSGTFSPIDSFALERGTAIHKMLEALPDINAENREGKARRYLKRIGSEWTAQQRTDAWESTLAILENPGFADYFAAPSRAEVSVSGKLETHSGTRVIAGQIDRLVVMDERILVLDYKTGAAVPLTSSEIPAAYVTQLALYREIVSQIYPEKPIECALLWTRTPKILTIPDEMLNEAIVKIKNI